MKSEVKVEADLIKSEECSRIGTATVSQVKSESKQKVLDSVLKKRLRSQAKIKVGDFLDFEADDDRDERKGHRSVKFSDEEYKRGKLMKNFVEFVLIFCFLTIETYTKEELARKTEAVDDVIKRLEEKYKDETPETLIKNDEESEDADGYSIMDESMDVDTEDLARNVNLPSNMDSKLWRLKVKPGMER